MPVKAKQSTIGDPGPALSRQCPRFCDNGCSNSASNRSECFPRIRSLHGLVSESQRCRRVVCIFSWNASGNPRAFFFEPPARGEEGLIEIVKGVFGLPDSLRGWWKELRDTLQETHENLSNWTLLSLAFVAFLDISSE